MPFSFPTTPAVNDIYTFNSNSWIWTGSYWQIYSTAGAGGGGGGGGADLSAISVVTASDAPQSALTYNGATYEFTFTPNEIPAPYVLPAATTTTLGGIIPDNITLTVDGSGYASAVRPKIYPAGTSLDVGYNGSVAYLFSSYSGDNPTLTFTAGTTVAFNLSVAGHPFFIQTSAGTNYNTGLVHVGSNDTITTEGNAQGKLTGTLYWNIPSDLIGPYKYICGAHANMTGVINIVNNSVEAFNDNGVQNTYNYNTGTVYYTTGRSSNWQANFSNVPVVENSVVVFTIIINQGGTGYYPSTVTVNSASSSILWANNVTPIPSANKKEIATFTIYYKGSSFIVLGNLSSYG